MKGRVLIIAGSDSGGGAGIQADIKTVTALGGFAMSALTALTAQNTTGVQAIHDVPADFVAGQITSVLEDLGADCIKIGMLHRADVIEAVAAAITDLAPSVPIVLDPVMVAKGGHALLKDSAVAALKAHILPMAQVLTPNVPEAAALTGKPVETADEAHAAGVALTEMGANWVLMKGGHMAGDKVVDLLVADGGEAQEFSGSRLETRHTHGTGCTLASAVATGLAQGMGTPSAVARAHAYVREAIRTAPGFGGGHGPLNHAHTVGAFDG